MKYVIMTGLAFLLAGLSCGLAIPASPVMISPGNNGTEVGDSPALKVRVSDPNNGNLRVVFYGRRAQADYGPDFMIVALPDTQYYVSSKHGGKPAMFYAQTDWIKANRAASNIVYVTQLGDCVEDGDTNAGPDNLAEWRYSTNALYRIETPFDFLHPDGIPYGVAVGNHDQSPNGDPDGTTTYYNQYFGESHFSGRGYYGCHYGTNNDNFFDLFNASGMDFIVVYLEFDPNANPVVLNWANNVLQTYPSRRAIVVSHYIGKPGTPSSFGPQGAAIYAALKANPNLFLMLSGHVNGEGSRQDTFNFHTVYTLVSDYQFRTNGGNGFMRLMQFSPSNNVIRVSTFSPWLNQYEADADSEFTVPYAMQSSSASFTAISTNINVSSGAVTSATWTGLQPNSDYEWQVKVTDALGNSVIGPTWRFTTGAVNSPPVATNATFNVPGDFSTNIVLDASDPNSDPLTFVMDTQPSHGLVRSFDATNGTLLYVPGHGFRGGDSFSYHASDGRSGSATATVALNVLAPGDANSNGIPDYWEAFYGVSDAGADPDGDGCNNLHEYFANTNPTNADSVFKIRDARLDSSNHFVMTWASVGGMRYRVQRCCAALNGGLAGWFGDVVRPVSDEMDSAQAGADSIQSFIDDASPSDIGCFYRVKIIQ